MGLPKTYETDGAARGGVDHRRPEGEIVETGRVPPARCRAADGRVRQRPPAYSAIKIGGERAYERRARGEDGRDARARGRRVTASRSAGARATAAFAIECSSGTYVRSLIADLGDAYCATLRRTRDRPVRTSRTPARDRLATLGTRSASCRVALAEDAGTASAAGRGRARRRPATARRRAPAEPPTGDGLIVDPAGARRVAERHATAVKPVVGFRA